MYFNTKIRKGLIFELFFLFKLLTNFVHKTNLPEHFVFFYFYCLIFYYFEAMEEKKLIRFENKFFFVVGEKLFNAQTKEEAKIPYTYVRNYVNDNICYIIIGSRFFKYIKDEDLAVEIKTELLCKGNLFAYYHTAVPEIKNNYVFILKDNGVSAVIGSSFQHIHDNLYKIGRFAYQIVDDNLEKLCECMEFEKIGVRIEISAEETGVSEMLAFKKFGKRWEVVNHWRPGNIVPSSNTNKSNLKK